MPEPTRPTYDELLALLHEAADALRDVGKAAIVVHPTLDKPYPDDPRWTPWTRFMEKPARRAYNLSFLLRRQLRGTPAPDRRSELGTRLYDAARELANDDPGHTEGCEWHTNGQAYCSCRMWVAACAGVDAVIEALDSAAGPNGKDGTP